MPFTFHWYVGEVPPFVEVAVKVTLVPAQIAPDGLAAMLTPTVLYAFTVTAAVLPEVTELLQNDEFLKEVMVMVVDPVAARFGVLNVPLPEAKIMLAVMLVALLLPLRL